MSNVIAVFPISMVKRAVALRAKDVHLPLIETLSYSISRRCAAAVMCNFGDYSKTHCGDKPIVGYVGVYADGRACRIRQGAYIAQDMSFAYPA
jgi:hypothetical protein